jgi:predicted nucleic acid-binding Zn ribbon protein
MPLFDFKCPECGALREVLVRADTPLPICDHNDEVFLMQKQPSAPSFKVNGFNQLSGYASEQVRVERKNGVRTEVRGNFEAFDLKA